MVLAGSLCQLFGVGGGGAKALLHSIQQNKIQVVQALHIKELKA